MRPKMRSRHRARHRVRGGVKLNQLREVVAIAEQGSIRAAARQLAIDQPALTRSLAELERELGASLFERRPRGVLATPIGELFLRRAASIVHEMRRAREEVEQFGGSTAGAVTAGLSIATHLVLLPAALRPFTRRYPDAKLHIIEGFYPTLEPGLRRGTVDFYLGVDPGKTVAPELTREVISQNNRTVLCRSGHPLQGATELAALSGVRWATNSITLADEDELGILFEQHRLPPPRIALRSQSALTLMTCLLNSDFMAMVPVQWTESTLIKGRLANVPVREELAAPPIVLIKRADLVLTPAARCFLDLLQRTPLRPRAIPAAETAPDRPHRIAGSGPRARRASRSAGPQP